MNVKVSGAAARRARNREQMHTAILTTAEALVTEHGVDGLTIRNLAQALSYSPGAIYEYFDSKEDILCGLFFQGTSGLGATMEAVVAAMPDASAPDRLIALARAYRAHAIANPALYRLAFGGMSYVPEAPKSFDHAGQAEAETGGFGTLVRVVREGLAVGSLVDAPVEHLVHAAWTAVHGFVSLELQGHITGLDPTGTVELSPEAARAHRDASFEGVIRLMLLGTVASDARDALDFSGAVASTPDMNGRPVT